jgi:hypothetical protein
MDRPGEDAAVKRDLPRGDLREGFAARLSE